MCKKPLLILGTILIMASPVNADVQVWTPGQVPNLSSGQTPAASAPNAPSVAPSTAEPAPANDQQELTIAKADYVARSNRIQHFSESIDIPKGQEKLRLTLTYHNGTNTQPGFKWLRIASPSMNYVTEAAFAADKTLTVDVTGDLTWGTNQLLISAQGPAGAVFGWKLTTIRPLVTGVSPNVVSPGNSLIITGNNFCPAPADNIVQITRQNAKCISANRDKLIVEVPEDAKGGENSVHVIVGGIDAGTANFAINATPYLSGLSANWLPPGQQLTIYGENFSPNMTDNRVYVGPLQAQVVAATITSITIIAPLQYGGYTWGYYQPVRVSVNGIKARNQLTVSVAD